MRFWACGPRCSGSARLELSNAPVGTLEWELRFRDENQIRALPGLQKGTFPPRDAKGVVAKTAERINISVWKCFQFNNLSFFN